MHVSFITLAIARFFGGIGTLGLRILFKHFLTPKPEIAVSINYLRSCVQMFTPTTLA